MFKVMFFVLVIPLSLLIGGIKKKLLARMQNRVGPPIYQPFYDMLKLLSKGSSDSRARENIFFRIIPFLYFTATYALFLFIPFPIIHFSYDFILFIYILVLSGALYTIAGFASNSPFGALGSMRELVLMVCYEIIVTVSLITFIVFSGVTSLVDITQTWMILRLPIASLCLFIIALLETRMTPLDTVEASTEIMGSVDTEYSGINLAFLETAKYLKLVFFTLLTTMFFFGISNLLTFFILSFVVLFLLIFSQATTCRYRLDQTLKLLMILLLLAVIEFVRIKYLVW